MNANHPMIESHQSRERRPPSCTRATYWGHEFLGEGTAVEVSPDSVRLVGNYLAVPGTMLQLMLYLPDDSTPLYVTRGVVRCVRGLELNIEFLTVPEEDQVRLDALCSDLRTAHSKSFAPRMDRSRSSRGVGARSGVSHILVIEDDQSIRGMLRSMLEQDGHNVIEAPNGRLGLTAYREKPADLVITDLCMPEMNGLDLISELRRTFLLVKVIAISGAPNRETELDMAKLLGVRQTLQKPFTMDALLMTVHDELAH